MLGETISRLASEGGEFLNLTVVVNGSSDDSMEVAAAALEEVSRTGARIQLACLDVASRTEALEVGDSFAAPLAHHLYLDQDVRISAGGLARVIEALDGGVQFAGARASWRTPSRAVRAAMGAWNSLPYVLGSPVTAGMYAVSAQGRRRWTSWPAGLPDDKFARLNFLPEERRLLDNVEYSALAPSDFVGLVKARGRYALHHRNMRTSSLPARSRDSGRGVENLVGFPLARLPGLTVLVTADLLGRLQVKS